MQRKKVVFILPTLAAGGAERVTSLVSQSLDKRKFEVTLVVIGAKENSSYQIDKIPVVFLEKQKVRDSIFTLFKYFKKEKPAIVISSIGHTNALMAVLAYFFPRIKFIGRITNMHIPNKEKKKQGFVTSILNKIQKKNLDKIICQSDDMKNIVIGHYQFPDDKIVVINNPISEKFKLKSAKKVESKIQFITVGRLAEIKGHLRILEILSKLNFDFNYTVIGSGPKLLEIENKAKSLLIDDKLLHIPFTDGVEKYLEQSDLFLQGSFSEGFPNALLESCAVGTPVLAFKAPGGTKEIIVEGVNGYIVNSPEEFLEKILDIYNKNPFEKAEVRHSVVSRFKADIIIDKYETLISDLVMK